MQNDSNNTLCEINLEGVGKVVRDELERLLWTVLEEEGRHVFHIRCHPISVRKLSSVSEKLLLSRFHNNYVFKAHRLL